MRPGIILAALALAVIGFAAFSLGSASAKDNPVAVGDLYFCNEANQAHVCETDITVGDSVTWTVAGGSHTVTQCTDATFASCSGGFNSGTLNQAGIYTRTFDSPGSYFYNCAFHPTFMMGKVVVAAAATATPTTAPTSAATASPTAAPSLPGTGGAPGGSGVATWLYVLLALGGVLLAGSGWSFALASKR